MTHSVQTGFSGKCFDCQLVESIGGHVTGGADGSRAGGVRGRQEAVSPSGRMNTVDTFHTPIAFQPHLNGSGYGEQKNLSCKTIQLCTGY